MQANDMKNEWVSDLVDGRLREQALADALQQCARDDAAMRTWHAYHVVGDVLRTPDLAQGHDSAFLKRLRVRLHDVAIEAPQAVAVSAVPVRSGADAANDAFFTWARVGAVMSVLAVAGLGWMLLDGRGQGGAGPTLVQAPASVFAASAADPALREAVMLRDPRLDQLLQAHRQAAGGAAVQLPAGFLRNATYEVQLNQAASR